MENQNLEQGYTKDQCSNHIKILIKILNPTQNVFQPKAKHCKAEFVAICNHFQLQGVPTSQGYFGTVTTAGRAQGVLK